MKKQAWSLSCCALALTLCVAPAAFAEEAKDAGKHLTGPEHDQGDKILMHPEDESIGFTKTILRDTSKDPKREAGPINIQRLDGGLAYMGIPTFFKLPVALTPEDLKAGKVEVAFMGAPVDLTISRRGMGWGPQAFRTSEVYVPWGKGFDKVSNHVGVDPFKEMVMVDYGDAPIDPITVERSIEPVRRMVAEIAGAGAVPIIIGGDHSLLYMDLLGITDVHGKGKVGVIHIDAHADGEEAGFGHYLTHGSPMRRAIEEGLVKGENFVQVGLRGWLFSNDLLAWMRENNLRYHFMAEVEKDGWQAVMERALEEARSGGVEKIFISFDIDGMDPGVAPAAASPEPGGLTPREIFPLLRGIAMQNEVVGMDVVEINPMLDHSGETMMLANRVVREVLVGMALRKKGMTDPKYLHPDYVKNTQLKQ